MSPQPPPSPDPAGRPVEDDFDWPPLHDDLSMHDLEGGPWSHLQAASNEAFAHRHGEPAPPRRPARAPTLQIGVVVGLSAALAVTAGWALHQSTRPPVSRVASNIAVAVPSAIAAPPEARPPRLTIVATYPVDTPRAVPEPAVPLPPAPDAPSADTPQLAALDEPGPATATSTEVPAAAGGPAIDEAAVAPAALTGTVAAPAAPPAAAWSARADDDIRDLLRRYEAAYDRRDVATAATLWPSLDQRALSRAFASLDSQDVSFERCAIDASGARGSAVCVGTVRYVPRVGRGVEKETRITWTFDLTRSGEDWRIARLSAR